jgi:cytochrome c oxidase cbb3-type subunit 3
MIRTLAAVSVAAGAVWLAALAVPADDGRGQHERGRAVYNFRCYFCHGYSGDAKTVAAGMLPVKPRDFTAAGDLTRERVLQALREGRPGTAMVSFSQVLSDAEMRAVAAFVVDEFVVTRGLNTRYHTDENGWPDHDRFADAFRFVREPGALALPVDQLSEADARGRRLFLAACISCHDVPPAAEGDVVWDIRPVSYPLDGHDCVSCHDRVRYPERGLARLEPPASYHGPRPPGGSAAAPDSPYAAHDQPVKLARPTAEQQRGEALYLRNCAFCHAADGTARHWIGRFLEPHPRDLTDARFRARTDRTALAQRIEDGLPGTAMPTWRNVLERDEIRAIVAYIEAAFGPLGAGPN